MRDIRIQRRTPPPGLLQGPRLSGDLCKRRDLRVREVESWAGEDHSDDRDSNDDVAGGAQRAVGERRAGMREWAAEFGRSNLR